ncbi:MAG: NYN domain-containing protein [Patescibacteria group bacterium]|nr:NYN domain-containing protein [Patescibacteria group bacterium]
MKKGGNNFAFIDSQNLNLSIQDQGWKLDQIKFRTYLREKYAVTKAYVFIGYMEENKDLYKSLQEYGYVLIFKPTLRYKDGTTKGNCDAELVLQAMIDYREYDKAVIVSGDGDFHCLADYLVKNNKLECVLIPNRRKFSALLKKINKSDKKYLNFMTDLRAKLELKKKKAL